MENRQNVKCSLWEEGIANLHLHFERSNRLARHGGLIRVQDLTIRVSIGSYRCPSCKEGFSECQTELQQQTALPLWNQDLTHYVKLVGTHGLPEEDRPTDCPCCRQNQRKPHRHSHYERLVITLSHCEKIYIFRFRCPDCGYVHSVIPAFLEPYMQTTLDLQEALVDAIDQGLTIEDAAEAMQTLSDGGCEAQTLVHAGCELGTNDSCSLNPACGDGCLHVSRT